MTQVTYNADAINAILEGLEKFPVSGYQNTKLISAIFDILINPIKSEEIKEEENNENPEQTENPNGEEVKMPEKFEDIPVNTK